MDAGSEEDTAVLGSDVEGEDDEDDEEEDEEEEEDPVAGVEELSEEEDEEGAVASTATGSAAALEDGDVLADVGGLTTGAATTGSATGEAELPVVGAVLLLEVGGEEVVVSGVEEEELEDGVIVTSGVEATGAGVVPSKIS